MTHDEAAAHLKAGLQAVLDQLPPGVAVNVTQQACVQGCIMMLVDMAAAAAAAQAAQAAAGDGGEPGWEGELGGDELEGWEEDGHWVYEPAHQPFPHIEDLNLQQQQQAQQQQQGECQAYREGTWTLSVGPSSGRNALLFLAFHTISTYLTATADGSLLQTFAAFLSDAAHEEAGRCQEGTAGAAAAAGDPVVVSFWGGRLKLALQGLQECSLLPANHACNSSSNSSSMPVRVVVVHGQQVAVDEEVQAAVRGNELSLQVEIPPASSMGGPHDPSVLALYILPSAQHTLQAFQGAASSSNTTASGEGNSMLGPLAHFTLLLLPAPAAAELLQWGEQQQLSQQQLQPLLEDMALAVEAAVVAATAGAMAGRAVVWEGAAAAAGRVVAVCNFHSFAACADIMAVVSQQLLVALRRVEPLAAGGLPPVTAAAAALVGDPRRGSGCIGLYGIADRNGATDGQTEAPAAVAPVLATAAPARAAEAVSTTTPGAELAPAAVLATAAAGAAEAVLPTAPDAEPEGIPGAAQAVSATAPESEPEAAPGAAAAPPVLLAREAAAGAAAGAAEAVSATAPKAELEGAPGAAAGAAAGAAEAVSATAPKAELEGAPGAAAGAAAGAAEAVSATAPEAELEGAPGAAAGAAEAVLPTAPEAEPEGAAEGSFLAEAEEPGISTNSFLFAATAHSCTGDDTGEKSSICGAAGPGTMDVAYSSKGQKAADGGCQRGNGRAGCSSTRVTSTQAVLSGGWSFWCWCVWGSLVGWSDRQMEAGYLAARVQHTSKQATWIMMGVIDVAISVVAGGRVLYNVPMGRFPGEVMVAGVYTPLLLLAVVTVYGLWLLL